VPRAIYLALIVTTIIYLTIQLVAQGTLGGDLGNYKDAPLAESAFRFLGQFGRTLLLAGATISAFGFVTSDILSSPRMIFAFGRDNSLPAWFAHVHPRYRTPDVAIITYTVIAFGMSVSGTFERLAVLSNIAVLLMYMLCCAGCWFLVQRDVRGDGPPFNFPGMKVVPVLAIVVIIAILAQSAVSESQVGSDTRAGLRIAAIVLAIASALYFVRVLVRRRIFTTEP
jgi:amino acid transporter